MPKRDLALSKTEQSLVNAHGLATVCFNFSFLTQSNQLLVSWICTAILPGCLIVERHGTSFSASRTSR